MQPNVIQCFLIYIEAISNESEQLNALVHRSSTKVEKEQKKVVKMTFINSFNTFANRFSFYMLLVYGLTNLEVRYIVVITNK